MIPYVHVDDPQGALPRLLRSLHAPAAGRVHCLVKPNALGATSMAKQLLGPFGVQQFGAAMRGAHRDVVVAMLIAEPVTDLFVDLTAPAHMGVRQELIHLAATTGVKFWVIDPHLGHTAQTTTQLAEWGLLRIDADAFARQWADIPTVAPHQEPESVWQRITLPDTDFFSFRADCRRLLDADDFAFVDRSWRAAYERTREKSWDAPAGSGQVETFLRDQIFASQSAAESIVAVRAAQAALYLEWILVQVNLGHFLVDVAMESGAVHESDLAAVRIWGATHRTAAALIALVARAHASEIAEMEIDDIAPDGSAVRVRGRWWTCPPSAQALLRAYRFSRLVAPRPGHQALFVQSHTSKQSVLGVPANRQNISWWLHRTAQETGLPVVRRRHNSRPAKPTDWARQRGIAVYHLDRPPAGATE